MFEVEFFQSPRFRKYITIITIAIALLPIITVAYVVQRNNQNVPFMDEWDASVPIAISTANGDLGFSDLISQHNESRTLVNNFTVVVLTLLTDWNIRVQIYVGFVIVLVTLLLILIFFKEISGDLFPFVSIPITFLLFSIRQIDNWLWSLQMQWFFVVLCLFAGLWILKVIAPGWKPISVALAFAFLGSFSFVSAMLLWPLFGIALFFFGYRQKRYYIIFFAIAFISVLLFLDGYDTSSIGKDGSGRFILNPIILGKYVLAYLGGPFEFNNPERSIWIGGFGLGLITANLLVVQARDRNFRSTGVWIVSAGFVLGSGMLTALGRARLFQDFNLQPLTSRYVTIVTPFWIALLAFAVLLENRKASDTIHRLGYRTLRGINLVALILLAGLYLRANFEASIKPWPLNEKHVECVQNYPVYKNDQCLAGIYPNPRLISDRIIALSDLELTIFSDEIKSNEFYLGNASLSFVGPQELTQYQTYQIGGKEQNVLFQHAPSIVDQQIKILRSAGSSKFYFAIYVDPQNYIANPEIQQDGVEFLLRIRDERGQVHSLFEKVFDPRIELFANPVVIDLSKFDGTSITITFEVRARENPSYDWSMWVDPRIIYEQKDGN